MEITEIDRLAQTIARKYKRRCWWADLEDMEQEARTIIVKCYDTYDPDTQIEFGAYAYVACARSLSKWLLKHSAPVSAPNNKVKDLAGIFRRKIKDHHIVEKPKHFERELVERVRERVMELAENVSNGEWAAAILLEGKEPKEFPGERKRIHAATRSLRRLCSEDKALYNLWEDIW